MITGLFVFLGGMVSTVIINYLLHEPNRRYEDRQYYDRQIDEYGQK